MKNSKVQSCVSVVLLVACASAVLARTVGDEPTQAAQLKQLVHRWDEAFVKNDPATLDGLLADEFEFVGGLQKTEYLASFKSRPNDLIESALSSDLKVQVYGKAAVVTGVDTVTGKRQGQTYTTRYLFMDVWIKRHHGWQCVKTYANVVNR